jgi:hypothetical protein
VIAQLKATAAAFRALVQAHIDLARAEMAAIAADLKQVVLEVGIALALVLFVAMLVPVGMTLFLGEWLFGSMGWGILHGTELSLAIAVALVLAALDIPRAWLARMLALAIALGAVVAVIFGLALSHQFWTAVGDALVPTVDPAYRPLLVAALAGAIVGGLSGIVAAARAAAPGDRVYSAVFGFVGGAVAGTLLGAFTAISFTLQVGIAIGIAVALAVWPVLCLRRLQDYDWEALQARFTPTTTIETAQETMEWLQQIRQRTRRA